MLGLLAQLLPQKREFLGQSPMLRSGMFVQAVLPSSCSRTYLAGSLRSTDITPLPGYYEPRRLPTRSNQAVMVSRLLLNRSPPVGSPRFPTGRSVRAAPSHPGGPDQCVCPLLPGRCQASPHSEGWPPSIFVTRPKRVQYLRLARSPREAPHPGLLRRTLARLHVERAIYMASSFQLARPDGLRLAHRMTKE